MDGEQKREIANMIKADLTISHFWVKSKPTAREMILLLHWTHT